MCKFTKPVIPADATADERRSLMFDAMYSLDLSDKCEKRENLTYLSWANAWAEFKSAYPSATYRIVKNPNTGLPYFEDPVVGAIVFTEVTVDDVTHEMWLPCMSNGNKALKSQPYTYQVWDNYKKQYVDKNVPALDMMAVNKTLMRCLTKNLSMFGLGLYIYAGDDLPEKSNDEQSNTYVQTPNNGNYQRQQYNGNRQQYNNNRPAQPQPQVVQPQAQAPALDQTAALKATINSTNDVSALVSLYLDNTQVIEANPELKSLLTNRKKALQSLNAA